MKLLKGVVEKVEESKVQFPKMNSSSLDETVAFSDEVSSAMLAL